MAKPVVAIIGRPNVGKSALFNRITEKRYAIVEDRPGVTRDRIYADAEWRNIPFRVIDTGGIEPRTDDEILKFMREQALIAIDHADVIIFITDLKTGVTAADEEVGTMLKKSKKPIVLAVNKMDAPGHPPAEFYEFYNLGMGDPIGISSLHGYGTGDLLDECFKYFPKDAFEEEEKEERINVAVIGKPNAGKSSLINRISGEKRVIVSNVAGTTRDSIDTDIENKYGKYTFVDTAGIRRKSKVEESVEKFSVMRAMMSIERADVCVIMIDAVDGITDQDTKIAGYAHDNGKACIIAVNKWDLIEKETGTQKEFENKIRTELAYMPYAPIVFISAMTGQRVDNLYPIINEVYEQNNTRITTGQLNSILAEATTRVQPPTDKGKRLKVYYMTQIGVKPPTFVCFCNDAKLFHYSYLRYLENRIRDVYGFKGTPIKMIVRQRGEQE
ncbi:MAG: ribosome biogenesis GTPase Der [Clostridia bacterium]|nr:ribosome biogenesis GTPase Der [Clostridia bacterium]MBQ7087387.1 ribosome biogenesis GTPase Der [Clostridia bacterium]